MSYDFVGNNGTKYLSNTSLSVGGPVTVAAWYKPNDNTGDQTILRFYASGTNELQLYSNAGTPTVRTKYYGGSWNSSAATGSLSTSADIGAGAGWNLVVFKFSSGTLTCYRPTDSSTLNADASPATSLSLETMTAIEIGADTSWVDYCDGYIGEVAVFSVALLDAEIGHLVANQASANAQAANLLHYWRCAPTGSADLTDLGTGNKTLTNNGTTLPNSAHPTLSSGASGVAKQASYYRMLRNA